MIRIPCRLVSDGMNVAASPSQSLSRPGFKADRFKAGPLFERLGMSRAAIAAPEDFSALLLAVARNRDQIAFARLFEYFGPRIKRFLIGRGMAALVAEDLAQETMLTVWRKAVLFDPDRANAATWIFSVARNQAIDHHRRDHSSLHADEAEIDLEIAGPCHTEESFSQAETEAQLLVSLTTLSADQIQVVRLAYFHDKSHTEIAGELGVPLGTVKSRLRLAVEKLRALMGKN